jgi:hypothetical protein
MIYMKKAVSPARQRVRVFQAVAGADETGSREGGYVVSELSFRKGFNMYMIMHFSIAVKRLQM